jgi:hypothetical protein
LLGKGGFINRLGAELRPDGPSFPK